MRTTPMFPSLTEWVAPSTFPDLSQAKEIAIDLETRDSNLERFGPGWPRKDGYIVGYGVAVDGWKGYYPVAHEGGGNLDKRMVERWIKDIMLLPCDKIMHNAAYDWGWLRATGFEVRGRVRDTMIAAAVLDENRFSYSLNALGFDYLKEVKSEQSLKRAAADFGVHPKKELWKLPAMYVGEYGEDDAALTLKLWQHFKVLLRSDECESIFDLETRLTPALMDMTFKGIRFDRDKCSRLVDELRAREKKIYTEMRSIAGSTVDVWTPASIAHTFDKLNLPYQKTPQGAPSFTKGFLDSCDHPLAKLIIEARETNKTHNTFLQPYLDFSEATGRVHPHVNQLKSDEGGTITGRLSMANPNLQQVPARHPVIGPMVRSLFLPEEGQLWASNDFSSQEPRLLLHYASMLNLPGSDELVQAYHDDPNTDFHQMVADLAGIPRKPAKAIGLGLTYGMGKNKLAGELGMDLESATELINTFHEKVPFLKGTISAVQRRIEHPASGGAIRTLLGRKARFPLWEPMAWGVNKALPYEQAIVEYGQRIKRAGTYKGVNKLIQGSAADQTKMGMILLHEAGERMLLQVHDELVLSVNDRAHAERCAEIMVNAVDLRVPSRCDVEVGPNWGEAK